MFPNVSGYEVTEIIGKGSFSTVYKARRKGFPGNSNYAVKCLDIQQHKRSMVDSILNEIKLLKKLKHEHIVHMEDFTSNAKQIFIIMEYCSGRDLAHLLKSKHKLPEHFVKKIIQQLSYALAYLRQQNVCHMDLKPQNLLLVYEPDLILKVADFGLSQYLSEETEEKQLTGSPLYMAPEKLLQHKFNAKVDLWSTGIIMYECLFGKPPYTNLNTHTLNLMANKVPIEIPKKVPISDNCVDLIKSLLKHDPEERISFDHFFNHPFITTEDVIDPYQKALSMIKKAIELEENRKYIKSLPYYENAVKTIESLIEEEDDEARKTQMILRLQEYTSRITYLKEIINKRSEDNLTNVGGANNLEHFMRLLTLAAPTYELSNALEIGKIAQMYYSEGKYSEAREKFTSALGILVPALQNEPNGERKHMLHKQIQEWLQLTESIKHM